MVHLFHSLYGVDAPGCYFSWLLTGSTNDFLT